VCEHGRAILGDVFVEQDARLDTTQLRGQRGLAVEEREIAQILTPSCSMDRGSHRLPAMPSLDQDIDFI
jgi:hypothetical protein